MEDENALPQGESAEAGEQTTAAPAEPQEPQEQESKPEGEQPEGDDKPAKKEKTPEQREIERLRRRVDNLTRQKYELASRQPREQNQASEPNEPVTLSRAELQRLIAEQARELAPALSEQQAEVQRRQQVVGDLAKSWGQERFNALASELDDALGGLQDARGRPKPATDAIFEADDPKGLIEYLTDPDHAEDAQRLASMNPVRAGREVARIEAAIKEAKQAAKAKPKPSSAPRMPEPVRGGGVASGAPDPKDTAAWIKWANARERAR